MQQNLCRFRISWSGIPCFQCHKQSFSSCLYNQYECFLSQAPLHPNDHHVFYFLSLLFDFLIQLFIIADNVSKINFVFWWMVHTQRMSTWWRYRDAPVVGNRILTEQFYDLGICPYKVCVTYLNCIIINVSICVPFYQHNH